MSAQQALATTPSAANGRRERAEASNEAPQRRARRVSALVAFTEEGDLYAGDLVSDIIDYRELRANSLAGDCITAGDTASLMTLEARLRLDVSAEERAHERRAFRRFTCAHRAHLVRNVADQIEIIDVNIVDLGGGGAKVELDEVLQPGEHVALMLKTGDGDGVPLRVTFECRIAWAGGEAAGVMFAGRPKMSRQRS